MNWQPQTYLCYSYSKNEGGGGESRHRVGSGRSMEDIHRAIADYKKSMVETYGGLVDRDSKILRYEVWKCPGWVREDSNL